jgi:hypothetical protein
LKASENRVLRRIFGPKWKEAGEDCIMRSFITCTLHQILSGYHVARMGQINAYEISVGKPEGTRPLLRPKPGGELLHSLSDYQFLKKDSCFTGLAGWLAGWLVGWLAGWLASYLRSINCNVIYAL